MNKIPLSEHFNLDEFLDPQTYNNLMRMVKIGEHIREATGLPVTINNWSNDGQYQHSGLRPPNCTVGSSTSEHRYMNAADFKIGKWTGKEMQTWAKQNAKALYELGVRRIEDEDLTPSWLHLDCKAHTEPCIYIIDLKTILERIYIK